MSTREHLLIDIAAPVSDREGRGAWGIAPTLITVAEAGRRLGIGRSKAYDLISNGELEVVHIGRAARVPVQAIDELVARFRGRSLAS